MIAEKPLAVCGCRKFKIDTLGDHLCTCTAHSGAKKAHDWVVDQLADLFRTTHRVKTQFVVKNRGQHFGDIELAAYLANAAGPVPLVLDLRIAHDRIGSSANPGLTAYLTGVQSAQSNLGSSYFHFRRAAFSGLLKSKCGSIIAKASALRVNLNLDGAPIASNSHTHPSHSQTSRLLTSSLSLGVPVPKPTQCMGGA